MILKIEKKIIGYKFTILPFNYNENKKKEEFLETNKKIDNFTKKELNWK